MAIFNISDGRQSFWQWDTGQTLTINRNDPRISGKTITEVQLCTASMKYADKCEINEDDTIAVPDIVLTRDGELYIYAVFKDENLNRTEAYQRIHVHAKKQPSDYIYSEDEHKSWDRLPEAIEQALAQAKESGEFDGQDGKSAYELAVINGFEGTEKEWLESLKGKSVTVEKVIPSTEDGAENEVTFSDGSKLYVKNGNAGQPGANGFSPEIVATRISDKVTSITVTNKNSEEVFLINDGKDGVNGKSAYQYAVEGGYEGTEEEFKQKQASENGNIHVGASAPTDGSNTWIDTDEEAPSGGTLIDVVASVGQTIVVKEVDENGKPTKWKAVDFPEDKAITLEEIDAICVIPPEVIAAGLYKNGAMVVSWDELIASTPLEAGYEGGTVESHYLWNEEQGSNIATLSGELVIPDTITHIDDLVFTNCTGLVKVTLPDTITDMGGQVFKNCSNLSEINIPSGISDIHLDCFFGTGLIKVNIPENISFLGEECFSNCRNLESVTIGTGVTTIQWGAFSMCPKLASITYKGTVAQWNLITKDESWYATEYDDIVTPLTQIICSDGTVTL